MRAGVVNDLSAPFRKDMQKMHDNITRDFSGRLKLIEDKVASVEAENVKLRQDLGNVSVTGSLQGDTLEQVVNTVVEQAILSHNLVTQKPFEYEVTIACPMVKYSPGENVEEKAKQLIHEGLDLPHVKVVRAMRTKGPEWKFLDICPSVDLK